MKHHFSGKDTIYNNNKKYKRHKNLTKNVQDILGENYLKVTQDQNVETYIHRWEDAML